MLVKELEKDGWINCEYCDDEEISQDEIDELVFHVWGWAMKLNVKKLKENKYLKKRVDETDFIKVFKKRQERLKDANWQR